MQIESVIVEEVKPRHTELLKLRSMRTLRRRPHLWALHRRIADGLREVESVAAPGPVPPARSFVRVVAWNVQRGRAFDGVLHHLREHAVLRRADIVLLTETDKGMARSGNRDVAGELGRALGFHSAFVPCYLNLTAGNGHERRTTRGENALGLHGNAILSRWPMTDFRIHELPNGKDKLADPEKRLGRQRSLSARVEIPGAPLWVACIHLDAHSTMRLRARQMRQILREIDDLGAPFVLGGDWNTSTYNSQHYVPATLGFFRRLAMGATYTIESHYLQPERYFERPLFTSLQRAGFDWENCNARGVRTCRYSVRADSTNAEVRDWIPQWCMHVIERALRETGGTCPFKLDWFATRGLRIVHPNGARSGDDPSVGPTVLHDLKYDGRPVSDHDPIVCDIVVG